MANVHPDFHGGLSYGMQFLFERFGMDEVDEWLRRVGRQCYRPLRERLQAEGLTALQEHWRRIFTLERGDVDIEWDSADPRRGQVLVLRVNRCPALAHMAKRGYTIFHDFCRHTRIVNEEICRPAGYGCSVESDQASQRCIQKFWKESGA